MVLRFGLLAQVTTPLPPACAVPVMVPGDSGTAAVGLVFASPHFRDSSRISKTSTRSAPSFLCVSDPATSCKSHTWFKALLLVFNLHSVLSLTPLPRLFFTVPSRSQCRPRPHTGPCTCILKHPLTPDLPFMLPPASWLLQRQLERYNLVTTG